MEKLYHYLWQSRMFGKKLQDTYGREVEVIDPGNHNNDAGPDFFNSKVRIEDTEWVGNVEIHVKASDWYRHGHHEDEAYDNVILHVVGISDKMVTRTDGSEIPQAEITMPEEFFRMFSSLSNEMDDIRCAGHIRSLEKLNIVDWIESLTIERLQAKTTHVVDIYEGTGKDWEQTAFVILARALGFGLNGDSFEMLARSIPLKILHHHSDDPLQLQALIFGQSGLLDSSIHIFDEYYQLLCREYFFLARKYGLRPLNQGIWKFARIRPQNSPFRRLAWLAKTCEGGFSYFSKIKGREDEIENIREVFKIKPEGYWETHFSFGAEERKAPEYFSRNSIDSLIINAVVPLIYTYGKITGDSECGERAASVLTSLPPENNVISRQWDSYGIKPKDAAESQALIQLKKEYCDKRKCLYCRFGTTLLRRNII